jgi:hypothetical protein
MFWAKFKVINHKRISQFDPFWASSFSTAQSFVNANGGEIIALFYIAN